MQAAPINALTIRVLLAQAERALTEGPYPDTAGRDAQTLLLHLLRNRAPAANRAWLIAHEDENLPADVLEGVRDLIKRRAAGEPLQYITGETEFYRLPIVVSRDVLIPRPETELLVEKALELGSLFRSPRILDVGVGSGAIAIALAHEWPEAALTATEISDRALKLARHNAERLGVANRIRFLHGDLLEPVASEQFEVVVSNPPYVAERDRETLSIEVRDYEPAQALFAGEDGLDVYRRLIPAAFNALVAGGFAVLEIGFGQMEDLAALLAQSGFTEIQFTPDLQGIPRIATAQRL